MKKVIMIMIALAVAVSAFAQVTTFRANKAMITEDGTWKDNPVFDLTGEGVFIVMDYGKDVVRISNKANQVFFVRSSEKLPVEKDKDGLEINTVKYYAWDDSGTECELYLFWYEGFKGTFGGSEAVIRVVTKQYMLDYASDIVSFKEKDESDEDSKTNSDV